MSQKKQKITRIEQPKTQSRAERLHYLAQLRGEIEEEQPKLNKGKFAIIFRGDAYGYLNSLLLQFGLIDAPKLWLLDPRTILPVIIVVILWMSMGAGFLSFVAGLQGVDRSLYEAGYVDGIRNRWQELYYITLPSMKPMLLFGAVMAITAAFNVCDVPRALAGYPSTDYAARTIVTHLFDYGFSRFEMGYASAIATVLFLVMILCNKAIQSMLRRVGT